MCAWWLGAVSRLPYIYNNSAPPREVNPTQGTVGKILKNLTKEWYWADRTVWRMSMVVLARTHKPSWPRVWAYESCSKPSIAPVIKAWSAELQYKLQVGTAWAEQTQICLSGRWKSRPFAAECAWKRVNRALQCCTEGWQNVFSWDRLSEIGWLK